MSKKKIVIGILICIVLLIALNLLINNEKKSQNGGTMDGTTIEGQLLFSGMSVVTENYTGDFETREITDKIQELVKKDIPELYENIKKLDEEELKKYYSENQTSIKNKFGIQSEEEFINFSNKISQTKIDLGAWHKVKINKGTFLSQSDKTNYAYMEFDIVYENEEKMSYSLYVANRKLMSPQYIFSAK